MAKSEVLTCKRVLTVIFFLGFMLHHTLRINMSMAIVDMIIINKTESTSVQRFDWNEQQKNDVLGSLYWGYTVAALVSGHLSEIYGTRAILGYGLVLATTCTLLTPATKSLGFVFLMVLRVGVGVGLGMQWTSVMPLATKWVAPYNISKFTSTLLACQLGAAVTSVFSGYLIKYFGWPSVFYVTGVVAAFWCLAWFYNVYDSPRQHPRISREELEKLERKVKYQVGVVQKKPWSKILTSRPVWANVITYTFVLFNVHSCINYMPLYMDQVLNFDVRENGLLSSLPFIVTYFVAISSSYFADKWSKDHGSLLTIRRIFTVTGLSTSALCLMVQSVWGYNYVISVVVFVVWQGAAGCHSAGCMPNAVDISPNYASTILGLGTGFGSLMGYLSTKVVALFIQNERDFTQWRIFFWILVAANVLAAGIYYIFASAEVQDWNNSFHGMKSEEERENKIELREV